MEELISKIVEYGYLIIAIYSFGGGFFAILGGSILASMGKLDIYLVIFIAGLSNFIGSTVLFYLGKYQKREVAKLPIFVQHRTKIALSKILLKKYLIPTIFIQKFLYGIKTLIPLLLGFTNYNWNKFLILNSLASMIWSIVIGYVAFVSSDILRKFAQESEIHPIVLPITLFIILYILWKILDWRIDHWRENKKIRD